MKNAMLIGVVSFAVLATGCNGGNDSSFGSSARTQSTTSGSAPSMLIQTNGCSASAQAGGALIQCGDGSSASIANGATGASGATGAQGPQGPQGAAGNMWKLTDGTGSLVGDYLLGGIGTPQYGYTVWVQADSVAVYYNYNGQPYTGSLYYTTSNCIGTPFAANTMPINSVFHNTGAFYKVTNVTANRTFLSYIADGQPCATQAGTTATYSEVVSYSNASIPTALTLPVTIHE